MISKTFPISLDINNYITKKTNFELVTDDENSYIFQISIKNNGEVQPLTDVQKTYIYFLKPDKTYVKEAITITDSANGVLSYTCDNNDIYNLAGNYESEIRFSNIDESIIMTSQKFTFKVRKSI